jgi:hypothetical protein
MRSFREFGGHPPERLSAQRWGSLYLDTDFLLLGWRDPGEHYYPRPKNRQNPYVMIRNALFEDPTMSWKAKELIPSGFVV